MVVITTAYISGSIQLSFVSEKYVDMLRAPCAECHTL